jgi:hypothetical protein
MPRTLWEIACHPHFVRTIDRGPTILEARCAIQPPRSDVVAIDVEFHTTNLEGARLAQDRVNQRCAQAAPAMGRRDRDAGEQGTACVKPDELGMSHPRPRPLGRPARPGMDAAVSADGVELG